MTTLLLIMLHINGAPYQNSVDFNQIKNYSNSEPTNIKVYKKVPTRWSKITKNSN